jgi:hypothetical protein
MEAYFLSITMILAVTMRDAPLAVTRGTLGALIDRLENEENP